MIYIAAFILYIVGSLYPTACENTLVSRMFCDTPIGFICDLQRIWAANKGGDTIRSEKESTISYIPLFPDAKKDDRPRNNIDLVARWPNNVIVYYIQKNVFNPYEIAMIISAMKDISDVSCITFRAQQYYSEHAIYILKGDPDTCFSTIGYTEYQILVLGSNCFKQNGRRGIVVHEFLHALGFQHTHILYNRDDFVTVQWENVLEDKKFNFWKNSKPSLVDDDLPYDYGSVMHYSANEFSKNGKDTVVPKEVNVKIGQRIKMSDGDIVKLNRMYCDETFKLNHNF